MSNSDKVKFVHDVDAQEAEFRARKPFKVDELRRLPETVREFDTHAQDRLVNYVFRKQIQMRNKGLL
jgi:hypothetical protein